ncbi:MAG: aldehyde dehydrogenase family protein [Dehalococcoidia bacterium]|nr:aldehyde dehydrogenase family protein [Dehalococcoidia bacterium]
MVTDCQNYINGRWVDAGGGETFPDRNPSNWDEVIAAAPRSGAEDADAAVAAAREAFEGWRALSRIKRAEYMDAVVQLAKGDTDELAAAMALECGKPINECRADVVEGIHMLQYCFGRARMADGYALASEIAEKDAFVLRKPKGVAVAITPWNFPFAIPTWLIGPSLTEGNTVVFKPSEETPIVGQRLVEYFDHVGLPPGVLNLVQGFGEEVGEPLVQHPDVNVVLFTGSYAVGSHIRQEVAKFSNKMAACEMGGKNAMIVSESARMEIAVPAALISVFKTTGQRCVSAERLLVHESRIDEFTERFVAGARGLRVGDPLSDDTFMGPLINRDQIEKTAYYNKLARDEGGDVLLDGAAPEVAGFPNGNWAGAFAYRMDYRPDARVLCEEVFGPHAAIVPFHDVEDAAHIYNATEYGFSLAVISEDYRELRRLQDVCDFGVGYVNLPTIGAEVHLPFGGLKRSGTGLPSASALIDVVTHRVAWTVNHAPDIKMAQGMSSAIEGSPA